MYRNLTLPLHAHTLPFPQSEQARDIEAAMREQQRETFEALHSKYQSHLENMVVSGGGSEGDVCVRGE